MAQKLGMIFDKTYTYVMYNRLSTFLRALGQHDVGHEGVITGRDAFSLRSLPAGSCTNCESEAAVLTVFLYGNQPALWIASHVNDKIGKSK